MATTFLSGTRSDFERKLAALEPMRRAVETHLSKLSAQAGYCVACEKIAAFKIAPTGGWLTLRETIVCPSCQLNGRQRLAFSLVAEAYRERNPARAHVFERVTPLFAAFQRRDISIEGSEYVGENIASGSHHMHGGVEIVHQDMHATSYPDNALDLVCHFDVLEHVADHRRALAECLRILRPGGLMLFTAPFFGDAETQIRSVVQDGELVHHHPPAYHGNPISADGSLVFFVPGWGLLDELRDLGFSKVEIGVNYDPFQGFVSDNNPHTANLMWPIFFRAVKG